MIEVKKQWKKAVAAALNNLIQGRDVQADPVRPEELIMETPPRPEMGDLAFPMFPFARILRGSPGEIAGSAVRLLGRDEAVEGLGEALAAGPYVNVRLDIAGVGAQVFAALEEQGEGYGHTQTLNNTRIMVEFSCPNTNKPLHLGHLRNDSLGHAISQILKANGAEVRRVNLINDRGIHICKSMAAYRRFGGGRTPESEGIKGDHFVGDYYVRYNEWSREDVTAEKQARELLKDWEAGDPEAHELWELMNSWALEGIRETYSRTDIAFEKIYYESETFSRGREEVLKGVEAGVFHKNQDGSVQIDLEEINLDKKVLLRSDGTSLYLTQDIGTAIARQGDWPFERLIYVVGAEQKYHFQVLFHILNLLGFPWARNLHHLSYGMVNLPEGKMKSREGKVADADELLTELTEMAAREIRGKGREGEVEDIGVTSGKVALGALNYYLLQVTPSKEMIFNPAESISFNGNTGPYLQYMGARISSVLRKYELLEGPRGLVDASLLIVEEERELIKQIAAFPDVIAQAGEEMNPSILAAYLYDISKTYSRYYHDNPVLHNDSKDLVATRAALSGGVLRVLKNGLPLLGIPFLEKM